MMKLKNTAIVLMVPLSMMYGTLGLFGRPPGGGANSVNMRRSATVIKGGELTRCGFEGGRKVIEKTGNEPRGPGDKYPKQTFKKILGFSNADLGINEQRLEKFHNMVSVNEIKRSRLETLAFERKDKEMLEQTTRLRCQAKPYYDAEISVRKLHRLYEIKSELKDKHEQLYSDVKILGEKLRSKNKLRNKLMLLSARVNLKERGVLLEGGVLADSEAYSAMLKNDMREYDATSSLPLSSNSRKEEVRLQNLIEKFEVKNKISGNDMYGVYYSISRAIELNKSRVAQWDSTDDLYKNVFTTSLNRIPPHGLQFLATNGFIFNRQTGLYDVIQPKTK